MAGIAIVLDLLRKNPSFSGQTLYSHGVSSAKFAFATAASASIASRVVFGEGPRIAFCDAGVGLSEDYISSLRSDSTVNLEPYIPKLYTIEQKPLLSAFHWRNLMLTSLRSFLLYYLPVIQPRAIKDDDEDDDEDFLQDSPEEPRMDLITPFKKSVKQILRETTVVTTRRVLERIAVHYVPQRMAWKLLKDVPKSAARKASRGMPTVVYMYSVSRTTLRGHCLGLLASWIVQVGIDIFKIFRSEEESEEKVRLLGKKIYFATIRCGSSLIFASIGAGIGAACLSPKTGQWIGSAIGEVAGSLIVSIYFGKDLHLEI